MPRLFSQGKLIRPRLKQAQAVGGKNMSSATKQIKVSAGPDGKLLVQRGTKKAAMTYEQVFSLGHSFFQAGHYQLAHDIFAFLARVRGRGPRGKLMLARCKAEIKSFAACNEILEDIFEGEDQSVIDELQSAFVFHTMGMRDEAIAELVKVVKEHPDFPSALLFLGDLFLEAGNQEKAVYCWKLAGKRDRKGGAIAVTARKQLKKLPARKGRQSPRPSSARKNSMTQPNRAGK
jgi:hypothetical protein